jgi:hypothetical protein
MVVLASHDDRPSELPLLCSLCTAWTELGYPVVVLDATQAESEHAPGLRQLLESDGKPTEITNHAQSNWPILPAATGLAQLCKPQDRREGTNLPPLQQLGRLFRDYEIVIVYASAPNLAAHLPGSGIEPLLTVSANGTSVLSAYQALKQLLINGRLQPTMVAVMNATGQDRQASAQSMCKTLQDCAMAFLGHDVTLLPVAAQSLYAYGADEMSQLALRLLESAVSLGRTEPAQAASYLPGASGNTFVSRSH